MVETQTIEYGYPTDGDQLGDYQPHLEFYSEREGAWVPSGVRFAIYRQGSAIGGLYRYRKSEINAARDGKA